VRNKGRDIALSLHLDRIAARLEALEAGMGALRGEVDRLSRLAAEEVDEATDPHPGGPWRGHQLVEEAVEMIERRHNGDAAPKPNGDARFSDGPPASPGFAD
jgi:hypothetical protein